MTTLTDSEQDMRNEPGEHIETEAQTLALTVGPISLRQRIAALSPGQVECLAERVEPREGEDMTAAFQRAYQRLMGLAGPSLRRAAAGTGHVYATEQVQTLTSKHVPVCVVMISRVD